jgi:hypothetical protein
MCHHGLPIPRAIADASAKPRTAALWPVLRIFTSSGPSITAAQQYDFTEGALVTIAQRAVTAKKPDDAYLEANLEYFPKSARTYAIAQVKNAKGDKQGAIKDLEKALELIRRTRRPGICFSSLSDAPHGDDI